MDESSQPAREAIDALPVVRLRPTGFHMLVYRKMIAEVEPSARPGDCVQVDDRDGRRIGFGLFNPRSQIVLRMLHFGSQAPDEAFWTAALSQAVALRTETLQLPAVSDAYRVVHAEGDGLSGLVVDRYGDVLSVEVFSLGMWHRVADLTMQLHALCGTRHHLVQMDDRAQRLEGIEAKPIMSPALPAQVKITEHGVRYRVAFATGHKTGFFCDQRDNRQRLTQLCKERSVLDVCSYTGGFGVSAKVSGGAGEVTCVDLDEDAIALARRNADLNNVRIDCVHADAFGYLRQMQANGRTFQVVVLDPPKLIQGRTNQTEGRGKYFDLNMLAMRLVGPGGLLLTCSCSGALDRDAFSTLVVNAAQRAGREAQMLETTSAGPDHPVSPRCPESSYLKAIWLRLA